MLKLLAQIHQKLLASNKTIAVAESCSAGILATHLTSLPGASAYFLLGVSTYSNQAKTLILNIPPKTILTFGAVSKKVAILMAQNIRKKINSDLALSITGIAGPFGATPKKPLGTIYIALATKNKTLSKLFLFHGSRTSIRHQAAKAALELLNKNLN